MVFEVKIHQSQSLTDYCEDEYGRSNDDQAASTVVGTLEKVFDQRSDFDVDASVGETDVELPDFHINGSSNSLVGQDLRAENVYTGSYIRRQTNYPYSGPHPDGSESFEVFDTGLSWWREYAKERIPSRAEHSNLLLTSTGETHGALGYSGTVPDRSNYSISRTGQLCAEFNLDKTWGTSPLWGSADEDDAMHSAIHEIGHNLLQYDPRNRSDNIESRCDALVGEDSQHAMGNIEKKTHSFFRRYLETPMSHGSYKSCIVANGNYCQNDVDPDADDVDGRTQVYSDCAWESMSDPNTDW